MRLIWEFTTDDVTAVESVVIRHERHPMVLDRRLRNLADDKPPVDRNRFWKALTMALLTTQQRVGPGSAVTRFLASTPFVLSYDNCLKASDVSGFVTQSLVEFGGIRRHSVIGDQLSRNFFALERGLWDGILDKVEQLRKAVSRDIERQVADLLQQTFVGIGPKQARNLLQDLGLTRYEVPLDSRVCEWLRATGFPVPVKATALADRDYYCFVLDGFQLLCAAANQLPCVVDRAVFASSDGEQWPDVPI